MINDSFGRLTVEITREQLECWVGHPLTDDDIAVLDDAIPNSSIPEAIDTIVSEGDGFSAAPDDDADYSAHGDGEVVTHISRCVDIALRRSHGGSDA